MLLHGGETINDGSESDDSSPQGVPGILKNHGQTPSNLEGRAMSALNKFGENARTVSEPTWLRRVQHQQAIMEPPSNTFFFCKSFSVYVLLFFIYMFFVVITASVVETPSLSVFLSEKGIPGGLYLTGEVMFILRPLVYVLLVRKYGARSWFPWITSLVVDLLGNGITSFVSIAWKNSNNFRLTNVEKNEVRQLHFCFYDH